MKTIETRYIGPTNTKGSRIVATDCGDHRVYTGVDNSLSVDRAHDEAARKLCRKLGWKETVWIKGSTKAGHVYVMSVDERVTL